MLTEDYNGTSLPVTRGAVVIPLCSDSLDLIPNVWASQDIRGSTLYSNLVQKPPDSTLLNSIAGTKKAR